MPVAIAIYAARQKGHLGKRIITEPVNIQRKKLRQRLRKLDSLVKRLACPLSFFEHSVLCVPQQDGACMILSILNDNNYQNPLGRGNVLWNLHILHDRSDRDDVPNRLNRNWALFHCDLWVYNRE